MLEIQDLTLIRNGRTILQKITFSVKAGEIYAVLGPNGAGKSSLAYAIMGCSDYKPSSGKIVFNGEEITDLPIWQRAKLGITLTWQEPARFEGIPVENYLLIGVKEKNHMEAKDALQSVLLDPKEYLERNVDKTLSGGERKRIELAAVYTMEPRLAILDEPDSGIDILALDRVMESIVDLRDSGTTVILITHQAGVAKIADRAALIGEGHLIKEGTTQEIVDYFEKKCLVCPEFR